MKTVIRKHLNVENVERIARENKYDEQAYRLFIDELEKELIKELHRGLTPDSEATIINKVVGFMTEVNVFRKKGFNIYWAAEYVYRSHRPEKAHAAAFACQAVRDNDDSDLMLKSIKLYARLTGRDKYFVEHFYFELDDPDSEIVCDTPKEELADLYSRQMQKLLAEGRSKHYAKTYAFYSALNAFPPYRCHIAGMEADVAKKNKMDDDELYNYADILSGYIYNHFEVYEDSLTDEKANQMRDEYLE